MHKNLLKEALLDGLARELKKEIPNADVLKNIWELLMLIDR